jgi:hypothetical protein
MNNKLFWSLVLTVVLSSLQVQAIISGAMKDVSLHMGAQDLTEVRFDHNSFSLTDSQKADLNKLVKSAREKGEIDKVKVLAWSDKEYVANKAQQSKRDIVLAGNRLSEVKKYINDQLQVADVESYNMAERPTALEELFKTSDAKVKDHAEKVGAAPRSKRETGLFGEKGESSKAVLMVFLKKQTY